jgi:4'-phosphopantetheinyl transferase
MNPSLRWLVQKIKDVPQGNAWLCAGEQKTLAAMRFQKRRNDWRLGRWTAKRAVGACDSGNAFFPSSIEIRAAKDGAPEAILPHDRSPVSVSISHSHNRCLCVIGCSDMAVGCDLELVDRRTEDFVRDYFTQEEQSFLERIPSEQKARISTLIWSAKECALKILREGLRRDTRSVLIHAEIGTQDGTWIPWMGSCLMSSRAFYGWWRTDDDYIHSIAADHPTDPPTELVLDKFS